MVSLFLACETLREVVLQRSGSVKDVVLAVHRLNQTLAKAPTFAECEKLATSCLLRGEPGADDESKAFLGALVDIVVSGRPESYPILCLLNTLALFRGARAWLRLFQVPVILKAVSKGSVEQATKEMANRVLGSLEADT